MRHDIEIKYNAISGKAYMYSAIKTDGRPIFASIIEDSPVGEVPDDKKGGIIIFPQSDGSQLLAGQLINWLKERFSTSAGWAVGNFLHGLHFSKNGKAYSDESLSVEITGISDDALLETGEELCRAFNHDDVLIKLYSDRYRFVLCDSTESGKYERWQIIE